MGSANAPQRVLLFLAAFSRYPEALAWARQQIEATWGKIALASPAFDFTETAYYTASMGPELKKQLFVLDRLGSPGDLAAWKLQTNQWELDFKAANAHPEARPLNLDPGYVGLGKLVLASTKDNGHRIYLQDGIYAEVTLNLQDNKWVPCTWTYPDYRRADYHQFLFESRQLLKQKLKEPA